MFPAQAKSKAEKVEVEWQSYSGPAGSLFDILQVKLAEGIIRLCGTPEKVVSIKKISISNRNGIGERAGVLVKPGKDNRPNLNLEYPLLRASALVECAK